MTENTTLLYLISSNKTLPALINIGKQETISLTWVLVSVPSEGKNTLWSVWIFTYL